MAEEDSMLLPITFVCVIMVVSLIGNSLVIFVFSCRWRSTGATKIFVLVLAGLDLVCTVVTAPRDLTLLTGSYRGNVMVYFCSATVFVSYLLNFASGFILIIIAITRFLKVTDERGQSYGVKYGFLRGKVMKLLCAMKFVKGAKIACCLAVCVSFVVTWPVLTFYAPADMSACTNANFSCRMCQQFLDPKHADSLKRYNIFVFSVFIAMVLILLITYSAVIRRMGTKNKNDNSERRSSVFCTSQSTSLGMLYGSESFMNSESRLPITRTMSEGNARLMGSPRTAKHEHETQRSVSDAYPHTETSLARSSHHRRQQNSPPADLSQDPPATNRCTYFPPVSYTAQQVSMISFNMSRRNITDSESTSVQCRRASITSFQFSKHGNVTRKTTFVFLVVTVIFVVSYLPFLVVCFPPLDKNTSAWKQLMYRSSLISNAVNPLVYAFCNPYFRSSLWKIFFCHREVI